MTRAARIALVLTLGLAACSGEEQPELLAPTDRFYYPIGLAVAKDAGGAVVVASSNFDLRYSPTEGGTLLSVDPATAPDHALLTPLGEQRIASYAGQVAVIGGSSCGGFHEALVASRFDNVLYRFGIGLGLEAGLPAKGALTCDASTCRTHFASSLRAPYPVAVACRKEGATDRPLAFVGFLQTPESTRGSGEGGWIAELDLVTGALRQLEIGDGPVRSIAYDPDADRVWFASRSSGSRALLHTVRLSDAGWKGSSPRDAVETYDLFPSVRGAELKFVAIGSQQRLYVSARLYDADYQASTGSRPEGSVGGVLIVLDVATGPAGQPVLTVHKVLDLGLGAGEVVTVPRAGMRDVVVATAADESLVVVYDDELEAVTAVFGRDPVTGAPELAKTPLALAVDPTGAVLDATKTPPVLGPMVYVAGFGSHDVAMFSLDPAKPWAPVEVKRLGGVGP
jgi:hypothetical protein